MQVPQTNTPITRCLALAGYTARMLEKFPTNAELATLAQRMNAGRQALSAAERAYLDALDARLVIRVDVSFEDYRSDRRVQQTKQFAEIADGRRGGRLAKQLFPDGASRITRLRGRTQIEAMRDLEARLQGVTDAWPQAADEQTAIAEHRGRYEAALQARSVNERDIRNLRAARDAAKQQFLDLFSEIASRVKAAFPRERVMQDLFFDDWRRRYTARNDESDTNDEPNSGDLDDNVEIDDVIDDASDVTDREDVAERRESVA